MRRMRFGVLILPEFPWAEASDVWRRAEQLGFDHAWTYDHIAWRSLRDAAWFGAIPTLTAAAMATDRMRLGTLVASPNFRHPVPFARDLIAVDDVSGGRLTVGLGSGGFGHDATVLGQEPWSLRERTDRFVEFVGLLDRLLADPSRKRGTEPVRTSYAGTYYSADEAPMQPGCVQQPRVPFALAATGPRGMGLVADHGDIWVTNGDRARDDLMAAPEGAELVRQQTTRLAEACEASGRDLASIDRLVLTGLRLDSGLGSVEQLRDTVGRYEEVGITDFVVHWRRPEPPFAADPTTFDEVISQVTQA